MGGAHKQRAAPAGCRVEVTLLTRSGTQIHTAPLSCLVKARVLEAAALQSRACSSHMKDVDTGLGHQHHPATFTRLLHNHHKNGLATLPGLRRRNAHMRMVSAGFEGPC
jgi:hypothetical protein